jgi:lysophospholipid acyltransferase (LPLAT)-like uncharacterized protein
MHINENLCNNAYRKIAKILTKASDLGMDLSGDGYAEENLSSGHVYLAMTDYNFTLFISLGSDEIHALWFSSYDGEEIEIPVGDMTLSDLEIWATDLDIKTEEV